MKRIVRILPGILFLYIFQNSSAQTTLPLSRTAWCTGAPAGWTDGVGATPCYSSTFACSGSNGGRFDNNGEYYQVFFSSSPGTVSYTLKISGSASSSCLVEESMDGTTWSVVNNHTSLPLSCTNYSFSLNCSSRYVRWTYTKTAQNLTIDDVSITSFSAVAENCTDGIDNDCDGLVDGADPDCAACTPASSPSVAPSSPIQQAGCNGLELCWTNGDGSSRLVVVRSGSAVTSVPVDQTTYTASSVFGSGNTTGALDYVVYNGAGNCVTITELDPSTTYHFAIFEYNGNPCEENYFTAGSLTGTVSTTACDNCPGLTSLLINSCAASPCSEGDNEIIFLNTRDYYVTPSIADIEVYYGNTNPATTNYLNSFTSNSTALNTMNTTAGCGTTFIDASTVSTIPPNSSVMIVKDGTCAADYFDWTTLCGYGPVYVFFSTDTDWNSSGNFVNSDNTAPTHRYLRTTIEGCTQDYDYDGNLLSNSDGEYVTFGLTGGAPNSYLDDDCSLPPAVLPAELLEFNATADEKQVNLSWITLSETFTDHFLIEKSTDGISYKIAGSVPAAGNSVVPLRYSFTDTKPGADLVYYRLAIVNTDYSLNRSRSVAVRVNYDAQFLVLNHQEELEIYTNDKTHIRIFSYEGKLIYSSLIEKHITINKSIFASGLYLISLESETLNEVKKIIIQR